MMRLIPFLFWLILPAALLTSCGAPAEQAVDEAVTEGAMSPGAERLSKYASFRLTTNAINDLTADERKIIRLLVTAANVMDKAFWYEAYGDKDAFLESIADSLTREYAKINYGPWDRLEGNEPFIAGVGCQAIGRQFLPQRYDEGRV
jgi:hypothetical protein